MSAAPDKAPALTEGENLKSPEAPKAASNALRFQNGGVTGIVESFAKLLKGVTYDAVKETMADSHGAAHTAASAEHPKVADAKADHPKAAETADGKEAGPAATAGHDDNDWVDDIAHWATIYAHLPFAEKGIKWLKGKLFPEIHEIAVDDQHIGDQILHKLKKDKKAERKGKLALDHHALEGFLKGLDIANLNRTFRMFTEKKRFETALERERGQEEIKKEIANLFDLSGEADKEEVTKGVAMLKELLHIHGHEEDGHVHFDTKKIDSRVRKQFEALAKIIWNAEKWLLEEGVLTKVYTGKGEKFEIDYDQFGDVLLEKVNKKNRGAFVKSFSKRSFDNTFRLLVKESSLKDALRHDSEKLKNPIYQLFDLNGKVDDEELKERMAVFFGTEGALGLEADYTDPVEKKKFLEIKQAFDGIVALLKKGNTLDKLFKAHDYSKFGAGLESVDNAEEAKRLLQGYSDFAFRNAYRPFLDEETLEDSINDEDARKILKQRLLSLMNIEVGTVNETQVSETLTRFIDKFDPSKMTDAEKELFETALAASDATGGTLKIARAQLVANLGKIETNLLKKDENRVSRIFKGNELTPKYEALGKHIINIDEDKLISLLAKMKDLDEKYSLVDKDEIEKLSSPTEKADAKTQLCALLGIEGSAITVSAARSRIDAIVAILDPYTNPVVARTSRKASNTAQFLLAKLGTLDDTCLGVLLNKP